MEAVGGGFPLVGSRVLGSVLRHFEQSFVHVGNGLLQVEVVVPLLQRWLVYLGECSRWHRVVVSRLTGRGLHYLLH